MRVVVLLVLCQLLLIPAAADAHTWLVKHDGSGDCTTIQACCDSADWYDTVLVAAGDYAEHIAVSRSVTLLSAHGLALTVITAPSIYNAAVRVYAGSRVEGFTIRDGNSQMPPVGGVYVVGGTLKHCLILGNTSFGFDTPGEAGGVAVFSDGVIEENTVVSNGDWVVAGGIYCSSDFTGQIVRNIVAQNTDGYGIYCESGASPTFICNNVWANADGEYGGACTDPTGTNGNISVDPLFCDPVVEDFYLRADSPCLNAPGCGLIGALGQGCMPTGVATETTWGRIKVLFR